MTSLTEHEEQEYDVENDLVDLEVGGVEVRGRVDEREEDQDAEVRRHLHHKLHVAIRGTVKNIKMC